MSTMIDDPRLITEEAKSKGLRGRLTRLNFGSLTVLIGLAIIWIIFQILNKNFLTPVNLTNLILQAAGMGIISVGITLVLLIGEIDLSAGSVSGLGAAVMAVLNVKMGVSGPVAILAGLATGAVIGLAQGLWITRLRVPSFIVTLAGFLGWQGALLLVLGETGTVNLRNPFILGVAGVFFPSIVGWVLGIIFVLIYLLSALLDRRQRAAAGLQTASMGSILLRVLVIAIAVLGAVAVFNADRGLPLAVVIFVGIVIIFDLIVRRTTFGRHIFAVGGNAEASRRATIRIDRVRVVVFTLCSMLAAAGGILRASRLLAVNQSSGSGDLLLLSIAAAVIGGTSLFGGRGTVWGALLGALVIQSISNGMDLLALASPIKFMVTGGVLLLAVTIDALARSRREATGR
jgi:D-xylose transport system permease protein